MRLYQLILQTIDRFPNRVAVVHKGRSWTYAEVGAHANSLKKRIVKAGFLEGDRVLLWMENSEEYIATYLALLGLGGVVVPIHSMASALEVSRIMCHVGASGVVVSSSNRQWTTKDFDSTRVRFILKDDQMIQCGATIQSLQSPPDLAQIVYTSGTTGQPKGVMLSHSNLVANTGSILEYLRLGQDDSIIAVLPFVYAYGNSIMLTHLFVGGKIVIENSLVYPKLILDRMAQEKVTGFSGVASTYALLLGHPALNNYAFPALRYLTSAGGPMPSGILSQIREVFPDKRIYLMYGQTEASARLTYLPPDDLDRKSRSVGRPISGVSLKIVKEGGEIAHCGEVGEVCARGENIMQGYWGDPYTTAKVLEGGWLHTGDIGSLDEEGYLTLVGRNNEMMKSGAYRISPAEVEEVLLQHSEVREAGVVGVEDPILGEVICAIVALKGKSLTTEQELLAYCARRLASYKRPKSIRIVDALPKAPSGKVLRQRLREIGKAGVGLPTPSIH